MSERTTEGGPGWSPQRVAALFCLGIAAGAVVGVLAALVITVLGGSWGYAVIAVLIAGVAGAVVATIAGLGSLGALIVADHWGERSPSYRAASAGIGAALTVVTVEAGILLAGGPRPDSGSLLLAAVVSIAAGTAAATGLSLFEKRASRVDRVA